MERAINLRELYNLLLSAKEENNYDKMQKIVLSNPKFYNLDVQATNTLKQKVKFYNNDRFHVMIMEKLMINLKIDVECAEKFSSPEWKNLTFEQKMSSSKLGSHNFN